MARRPDPTRIYHARRAALVSRLVQESRLPEQRAEELSLVERFLAFSPWRDPKPLSEAVNRGLAGSDLLLAGLAADFSAWALEGKQASRTRWPNGRRHKSERLGGRVCGKPC